MKPKLTRAYCEGCETEFDSAEELFDHDCENHGGAGDDRDGGALAVATDGGVEVIRKEIPIEQALNGDTREEIDLDDEYVDMFIEWEESLTTDEIYRKLARKRLDDDDVPQAEELLWIDQAEVYSVCPDCYLQHKSDQWTGSTQNSDYAKLRRGMLERLDEGVPCSKCRKARVETLQAELEASDEIEVQVEVVEE